MPDIDRFGRSEMDYSRPSTPIQSGGSRGEFSDRLYTGRNPFIQPFGDDFSNVNTPRAGVPTMPMGMPSAAGQTRFGTPSNIGYDRAGAGIFGGDGSSAYAANDIVDAIMGGMNRSQEGAGFDIAGGPGMVDKRMEKKLWGKAVNSFPPGTPDMILQQEWERLKQIYFDKKYGGGQGLNLPSRDDIVGLG